MKGGSLTRFKPDPQDGGGFVQELLKASVMGGLKGLKSGRGREGGGREGSREGGGIRWNLWCSRLRCEKGFGSCFA